MSLSSWFRYVSFPQVSTKRGIRKVSKPKRHPWVELLEARLIPALVVTPISPPPPPLNTSALLLAQELLGAGVTISNATLTAHTGTGTTKFSDSSSAGSFTGGTGIIGFDSGIILSTGGAANVLGPNSYPGASASQNNGLPGDPSLDSLINGGPGTTADATVLSFDFTPTYNNVVFKYVFASEEYPGSVGSQFNDAFGFFVNGSNVALLPNSTTPVSINTVNSGTNSSFFVDNTTGAVNTEMNGLTTVFTAVAHLIPNTVNHIKLAIADGGDQFFDSNVFIQANSLASVVPPTVTAPADQTATEGTAKAFNIGSFADPQSEDAPWQVTVNWGDGSPNSSFTTFAPGSLGAIPHSYADNGNNLVTVSVADNNGITGQATFHVNVANANPVVTSFIANQTTYTQDGQVSITGSFSDLGVLDAPHTVSIQWGDGTTSAVVVESGGSGTFSASHTYSTFVTPRTVIATVTDKDGGSGTANLAVIATVPTIVVSDPSGLYTGSPYTATATATGRGGITVGGSFTFTYYVGSGTSGASSSTAPTNVGTYTVVAHFTTTTSSYISTDSSPLVFTISVVAPTVTAIDAGGVYNGTPYTATATALGVDPAHTPVSGSFTFTYYVGAGTTGASSASAPINVGTYTVVAHFVSANTNYSNADSAPVIFSITSRSITVSAITTSKVYDGTTVSLAIPSISGGTLAVGDVAAFSESYDSKNVGTNKTMTATGSVNDNNSGNNYAVTFVTNTTGTISARPITVTSATNTKNYDANTTAAGIPTITAGTLATGDTGAFTETYDTKNVGTGKTMIATGSVLDGNSGNNYAIIFATNITGAINSRPLTVTATSNTKIYDGNTSALASPTITGGSLLTGDTASFTETYDTKNVGSGKTLTATGSVVDGNSGNNYAVTFVTNTTGSITARAITVTAATNTKGYDGNTSAAAIPTITGGTLVTGEVGTFTETYDTKHVGTGKTLTATGGVADGNGGNNYAITFKTDSTGAITVRSITVSATTNTKIYDGNTSATAIPIVTGGSLVSGEVGAFTETYDTKNVGTGKTLTATGGVADGNGGNNYAVTFKTDTTGAITVRSITVSATTNTKGYDGNTSAAAIPTVTGGTLVTGEVGTFTETYDTKNIGTGKTLTATGGVADGNGGNNYAITFKTDTTGAITARAITVTAATNTKGYDGNTSAAAIPTVTGGTLITGDVGTFTETYDTKNVGTGKTLTATGGVTDGNGGNNYAITFKTDTTGAITARAITVTAATNTKGYDGNTSAAAIPTVTGGTLVTGEVGTFTETYDTKHVGTGKTLTATGGVADGNGGNNYAITFKTDTTGAITVRSITVSATTNTKIYDGNTSATAIPTVTGGSLVTGEVGAFTETYDTKNVGTGKTLTATGGVADGNGGNNYAVTFKTDTTGAITVRSITVSATTNTKGYDGNTSAAAIPTVTGGTLVTGEVGTFTETYDTKIVGTGKTLTATGGVADGNGGNNYAITFKTDTTGAITARAITVTSATNTKGYDGNTSAAGIPTVTGGTLVTGDVGTFTETYDTKNVGTGKTLTATGGVADGNGGNNYAITFKTDTTGAITARAITVTAATNTKGYDGNTSAAAVPTITGGTLVTGEIGTFTETYDTKHVGTGKTLTATGGIADGNGGNNYAITFKTDTTGAITVRSITVSATTNTKVYDGNTSAAAIPTVTGGTLVTGEVGAFTETYDTKNVGTGKTLTATGGVADGNGGNNYAVTFKTDTTGAITVRSITVSATTNTKGYDGNTSAAAIPTVTGGTLVSGEVGTFTETYDTKIVGTGKTLTATGGVADGNGGNNYAITFKTDTTGAITARAITVTAATNTKGYDGNTSAAGIPTVTGGTLVTGDVGTFTETYDTKNVGTGKTLTATGGVTDGNGGNNYAITFKTDTTGAITARAITVTAATNTKGYDGNISAAAIPTITGGALATGDSASFTEAYDNKNVGTGKTLTVTGGVTDGNSGNNYAVSMVTNTTGAITARAITVSAATNTKGYDSTTSATATPTITGGTLATGDTAAFTESYDSPNVSTGKTLTASGSVADGNSGNNYAVTLITNTTGVITSRAITVTAATNTKGYDGTSSAAATPTITGGSLVIGDSASFTENYDTKNVGTGKTLTASGSVVDGNGGANYNVTFITNTTGTITTRALTVTAVTNTKNYDGTTSAVGIPLLTGGSIATGDSASFIEAYNNPNSGTGRTLTPSGSVTDGNSGNNYAVTFANDTTGVIIPGNPTVTAIDPSGVYNGNPFTATATAVGADGHTPVPGTFTFTYYVGAAVSGPGSSTAPTDVGTYTVVAHFTSGDVNYNNLDSPPLTFNITKATPTVTAIDTSAPVTGSPFVATGSAVGVDHVTPVVGTFTFTYYVGSTTTGTILPSAPSTVGTYTVVAHFTSLDGDYTNADSPPLTFQIQPPAVIVIAPSLLEGNVGSKVFSFKVVLSGPSPVPVTVNFATSDGTNADPTTNATVSDHDYAAASGQLVFTPGGPTTQTVNVTVFGDTKIENDENFKLILNNAINGTLVPASTGVATIVNDDLVPTIGVTAPLANFEGNLGTTQFIFTITLTPAPTGSSPVSVHYQTVGGTAISGINFLPANGTIAFNGTQHSGFVTVYVKGNTIPEPDETFSLLLSSPIGSAIFPGNAGTLSSTAQILNDDGVVGLPRMTIVAPQGIKPVATGTPFVFAVSLSAPASTAVTFSYTTVDGTATSTNAYTAVSGTVTIAAGQKVAYITVIVKGDPVATIDEFFTLQLSGLSNAVFYNGQTTLSATGLVLYA